MPIVIENITTTKTIKNMKRKELKISVPDEKLNDNDWDFETFYLREHLHELIKIYGLDVLKEELNECEWFLNKN